MKNSAEGTRLTGYGVALACLAALAVLLLFYVRLFALYPINSDQANALLAAQDMAAGNWRLHGWWLAPDNYWGLDEPVLAALWLLTGNAMTAIHLAPAVALAALGLASTALALRGRQHRRASRALVLAAILLVPAQDAHFTFYLAQAPMHMLTITSIILEILLADFSLTAPGWRRNGFLLALGLVAANAAGSDPMFIYLGAAPLILALLCRETVQPRVIAAIVIGVAAGHFLVLVNSQTGGFSPAATDTGLNPIGDLPRSFEIFIVAVIGGFGCNPFDDSPATALLALLRVPLLLLTALALSRTAGRLLRSLGAGTVRPGLIDTAVCLTALADIAAVLLSRKEHDLSGVRFFIPGLVAGAILTARYCKPAPGLAVYLMIVTGLTLGHDVRAIGRQPWATVLPADERTLIAGLEARGLQQGYGSYWLASITTVATGGAIRVFAVGTLTHLHRIVPFEWFSKSDWYDGQVKTSRFFTVVRRGDPANWQSLSTTVFGQPDSSFMAGDIVVNVYKGPLPPLR